MIAEFRYDVENIFEYARDLATWLSAQTLEDSKHYLNIVLEQYTHRQLADWGILHPNHKLIGTCCFANWIPEQFKVEIA